MISFSQRFRSFYNDSESLESIPKKFDFFWFSDGKFRTYREYFTKTNYIEIMTNSTL